MKSLWGELGPGFPFYPLVNLELTKLTKLDLNF